jgi:CubicO group peptidase (beta-lactamase class C family)
MSASAELAAVAAWPGRATAGVADASAILAVAGPADEVLAWASVTKLLTAYAALIAIEEGIVALDDPAGPPGATFAHLLAHASGLAFEGDRIHLPLARRRVYSNLGIEVAAQHLSDQAGMSFAEYLDAGVLQPLGMTGTALAGSPAAGARGPLTDLLRFGRELLSPTLVSPETLADATRTHFPGLDGVLPGFGRQRPCDWGLGFELRDHKSPHWTGTQNSPRTFGHFGRAGSFLWVDPEARLACGALGTEPFGPWAAQAWPPLSDAVLTRWRSR